ncbi:IS30 family transposase [Glutamicibacter protophormiae]|uniref:IS30 family transposase n=1 Tax=Glutamicibacter protophormiae TaxID=37930 RepID=A0ABS4XM73_GLUPR|nr:IS30 family transposase [Glutamicibacter protophormiae]GGL77794.1 hypothetical protein GCM10010038_04820 [Glutamicibacter protophormiae]
MPTRQASALAGVSRAPQPASPGPRPAPANKLTTQEEALILETLNSERFVDQAPEQIYAVLLSEGTYLFSVSAMYRLLRREKQMAERRRQARQQPGKSRNWSRTSPERCSPGTSRNSLGRPRGPTLTRT